MSLHFVRCSAGVSVCLACLTVFVNCLAKEFEISFGVVASLLLNVMAVLCL